MAATAAAAISSSFSSSMHTLKCMRSNHWSSDNHNNSLLKLSPPRLLASISHSHPYTTVEHVSIGAIPHKWPRALRISAAVAQEEAAATATEEAGLVEEEVKEVEGDEEAEAEAVSETQTETVAAATATEEAGLVEEEVKEVEGDEEAEGEAEAVSETQTETVASVNTKLYFGNLPYNVDSAQLAGIIQDYGSPELIEVLYDRATGRSRGFAFVTMSTVEDCNAVIDNLDGREYLGRCLRVNFSDKPRPKVPLYAETDYKLFVGNLSWSVTTESLSQAFQKYGNVVGARVLYDGETGMSRGYGFVCYATKEEMDAALESLNGVELEGRAMRVSLAEGKRS